MASSPLWFRIKALALGLFSLGLVVSAAYFLDTAIPEHNIAGLATPQSAQAQVLDCRESPSTEKLASAINQTKPGKCLFVGCGGFFP